MSQVVNHASKHQRFLDLPPNYSVKWTAATCRGNLTLTVAAATYLKR